MYKRKTARKPKELPKNYVDATFKMGEHEFSMALFFQHNPFAPVQIKRRRARIIRQQSADAEIIALADK